VRFEIEKPSGRDVLRIEGVDKAFGKGKEKKVIFQSLSLNLNRGDKLAVIGANGIGKSTLLKLMVGAAPNLDEDTRKETYQADKGEIRWGHETSVGYFAQDHHEALGQSAKGMNAFQWLYQFDKQAPQEQIRGILGRLLFSGEAALKPTEALSGGECARLLLAKLLLCKPNVLVMDEPTNHLDIESIEGLLDGLKIFTGTIVVVSHDRHFVSDLATRVVELRPGEVLDFSGTYDEYLEKHGQDYMRK
jgi:ATPase subunit of ABC transporter with duplicated ATPase domains